MTEEQNKKNFYPFFALLLSLLSFTAGLLLKKNLHNFYFAYAWQVVVLFVPLLFSLIYVIVLSWKGEKLKFLHAIVMVCVFCAALISIKEYLFQNIQHFPNDDGYRYSYCAHNMVNNKTLWGGDRLVFPPNNNSYHFQPGFRYFLALEILIIHHENRLLQATNIMIWCLIIMILIVNLQNISLNKILFKWLLVFLSGASLYACKNILLGLSEWFCTVLLIMYLVCILNKKVIPAIIFLGLAAFVRQNQLPCILLLFALSIIHGNKKILASFIFVLILCLPLFHNLYYDNNWAFFQGYNVSSFFIPVSTGNKMTDFFIMLRNTSVHYLGFDWQHKIVANLFGIIFIPSGVFMGRLMYLSLLPLNKKIFIISLFLIFISSILLNWAYFPRFEFLNLFFMMAVFIRLWQLQSERVDLRKYFYKVLSIIESVLNIQLQTKHNSIDSLKNH